MLPLQHADVAQSVERILGKDEVTSSNLVISSSKACRNAGFFVYFGLILQVLLVNYSF